MNRAHLLAGLLLGGLLAAPARAAEKPDWCKPFLKAPVPSGSYIAKADEWVVLHGEVTFSTRPDGQVVTAYRQVLGANGQKTRKLELAIDYDEGTERLLEPQLLVPGAFGYKEVNLKKSALDLPDLAGAMVGSDRIFYLASRDLYPDERAVVSWEVEDRESYPGMTILFPYFMYPTAELVVRAEKGEGGLILLYCEPQPDGSTRVSEGGRTLRELPAMRRLPGAGDRWAPHPSQGLPYFVAIPASRRDEGWEAVAGRVAAFFDGAESSEDRAPVADLVSRLAPEGMAVREKAAALCGFVQSLTYRNVAWGTGAYIPQPPRESLRTLTADCKGKVVLLRALLAQAGLVSVPVLCDGDSRYAGRVPIPDVQPFNHVVLAIRLPGGEALPGSLSDGPGKGMLLFDPTDALAVLGGPSDGLEGTTALWLAPGGGAFDIHTTEPSDCASAVRLRFRVEGEARASFTMVLEGYNPFLREVGSALLWKEPPEKFRERCQRGLLVRAPGAVLQSARYVPPDHVAGKAARLEVEGFLPSPLQRVGGGLYTCLPPASMAGAAAGIPLAGYVRDEEDDPDQKVAVPDWCRMFPRFLGQTLRRKVEVALELPAGWTLEGGPSARRNTASPWLDLSVSQGPPWTVSWREPRGVFGEGTEKARLEDLNAAAALFRKPFVLRAPSLEPGSGQ